jgi:signal transduction histidine kinase
MKADLEGGARQRIYLVDSDKSYCDEVVRVFAPHNQQHRSTSQVELELEAVGGLEAAMQRIELAAPRLVIANYVLADGSGMELLSAHGRAEFPVVITSDTRGEVLAVEAIKAGAINYVVKTELAVDRLPDFVNEVLFEWALMVEHERLQLEVISLPQREQQHFGRELHDGLGQQLTGLGLLARSLMQRVTSVEQRELDMLEQLATGIEQALAEVRTLSRGLVPVQTDAHGLVSALEELAARVARQSGIKIELAHENPILISDNETATHVYRIVQEAINNAVKHARADRITLILEANDKEAVIEVRDNGQGLPCDVGKDDGMGLRTMFHRCNLFGGSLDVSTHEEGGTRVRCCFPLHPEQQGI